MERRCSCCGALKPISEFNKGQKRCRPCDREYLRAWRANNHEKANNIDRAYRSRCLAENAIGFRKSEAEKTTRYRAKHKDKVKIATKAWTEANRARVAWRNMLERCSNDRFSRIYSSRGITVCDRWHTYGHFLADMGEPPLGMTLDRMDNNKGYEPGNCRWATKKQQGRNKRNTIMLTNEAHTKSLADWADELGIKQATLYGRIFRSGWSTETALTAPIANRSKAL